MDIQSQGSVVCNYNPSNFIQERNQPFGNVKNLHKTNLKGNQVIGTITDYSTVRQFQAFGKNKYFPNSLTDQQVNQHSRIASIRSLNHSSIEQNFQNSSNNQAKFTFNTSNLTRFCFSLWIDHQIAANIADYHNLFNQLKSKSSVKNIYLQFQRRLPTSYRGVIINIQDQNERNQYQAFLLLIQHFSQMQNKVAIQQTKQYERIRIVVPEALTPSMIGKKGKLIQQIKELTRTDIVVEGPFKNCWYQSVRIKANIGCLKNIADAAYLTFHTIYNQLKRDEIWLDKLTGYSRYTEIGIVMDRCTKVRVFDEYSTYIYSLQSKFDVKIDIHHQFIQKQQTYIYLVSGRMLQVKAVLCALIQVIQFQQRHNLKITLAINSQFSRSLVSCHGKFIREISSKSGDSCLNISIRSSGLSHVSIEGNLKRKLKAASLIIEFSCYYSEVLQKQKSISSSSNQHQLKIFAQVQGCIQEQTNQHRRKSKKKIKTQSKCKDRHQQIYQK